MTLNERAELAAELKNSGVCNCAQAVTRVLSDQTTLTEVQLMQLSSGFAAGMGNMEATCGAMIGAAMIAGLKTEGKCAVMATRKIQEEFQNRCGALRCKDLKAVTDGRPLCPCDDCVRNAVMVYGEVMGL